MANATCCSKSKLAAGFIVLGLIAGAMQAGSALADTGVNTVLIAPATMPSSAAVRAFNVKDYGTAGDGKTNDTTAIESAIKAASVAGGGQVVVPAGTYFCTPIELLSNVNLHLDKGATLLFSTLMKDYPLALVDDGSGKIAGCRSPIWSENQKNVAISGDGVIDGQGSGWRQTKKAKLPAEKWDQLVKSGGVLTDSGTTWYPDAIARDDDQQLVKQQAAIATTPLGDYEKYRSLMRPNLIRLSECQGVSLSGVTFRQSASWNIHLSLCDDIQIHHITVYNPSYAQNGDGIDLDSCRNVLLADSTFNAGDDGICIKSGMNAAGRKRGRPTENVTITRCTVGTGHGGVVIGSEMSGGVRNINVSDCVFKGTDNGLRFKSVRGRGGVVENVTVNNVQMSHIQDVAVLFDLYYMTSKKNAGNNQTFVADDTTPVFRHFLIRNVTCNGAKQALQLRGLPEMPVQDIELDRVDITADHPGMIVDAKNIKLKDVHIKAGDGKEVSVKTTENLQLENCSGIAAP